MNPQKDLLTSILEAPCHEMKQIEPFPFKNNRISGSIRFQHHLILFPFYSEYKECQCLYTFNLLTRKWDSVELRNSPKILENTDNYKIIFDNTDGFLLFGCYKDSQEDQKVSLFNQFPLKKTLGWISVKIVQDELILDWKEWEGAEGLPYLEKFCFNLVRGGVVIFGGRDENGKMTSDLYYFHRESRKTSKMNIYPRELGEASSPIFHERMNPASNSQGGSLQILGGEDRNSNPMNDSWHIDFNPKMDFGVRAKFNRKSMNICPNPGAPCLQLGGVHPVLLYIGKSTTEPVHNYLCAERFNLSIGETQTRLRKEPLPFNGIPHTMEIFNGQLILGFESSIYSIIFNEPEISPKSSTEKSEMRQYFEERPSPDVTFKVQGEDVKAHRGILSAKSLFFQKLLACEESEKPLEITDLSPEGFDALLEWVYCEEIEDLKEEIAVELVKVTDKYLLVELKIEAEECLAANLTIENVVERAKLAVENRAMVLQTTVVNFVAKYIEELNRREELNQLPNSIIYKVCKVKMSRK